MSSFHEHCMITFLASMASMQNIILNISVMVRICVSLLISKGKLSTCHQYNYSNNYSFLVHILYEIK